jgi:hypothetical protein
LTGVDELPVVPPLPRPPLALEPQHLAFPLLNVAHVWTLPALIATAFVKLPPTNRGVLEFAVPLPSWPDEFSPQHLTVPLLNMAHEWVPPALIATTLARGLPAGPTGTGVLEFAVVPLPSWPDEFNPQHLAFPLLNVAHECVPPALIETTLVRGLPAGPTGTGVLEFAVVPLPS